MDPLKNLRKALIAALTENNAAAAKAIGDSTETETVAVDAWGFTDAQRRFIGGLAKGSQAAAVVFIYTQSANPDRLNIAKATAYSVECERLLASFAGYSSGIPYPALTAIRVSGTGSSSGSGLDASIIPPHRGLILVHQIKGYVLPMSANMNNVVNVKDGISLVPAKDIPELVDTLTASQIVAVLTNGYFQSVRDRAGIK